MDCSAFENRLTKLLAGEFESASARETIGELERHARTCADCADAKPWIELATLPARERDPMPDPGDDYWADFNPAVATRIGAASVPARGPSPWRRLAVAAALIVALGSGWLLRGWLDTGGVTVDEPGDPPRTAEWTSLEEVIRDATPEELAAALRSLPGGAGGGFEVTDWELDRSGLGDWVPELDALQNIDEAELLEWLDQTESKGRPTS